MKEQAEIGFISYRNAYYQGKVRGGKRHGDGVLIIDDGVVLVGTWRSDQLFGHAFAFLNAEEYAFLEFNRGELEGHCYIRSSSEMLLIDFNSNKPIERQLLVNFDQRKAKISIFKNGGYELIDTHDLEEENNETRIVEKCLHVKYGCLSLLEYLEEQFCHKNSFFQLKSLPNGNRFFKFNDPSNPLSLGLVVGKGGRLVSYGGYLNDKLNGYGCKYENSAKYEGIFQGGFLNGVGLKYSNNRYSFGRFENGNLVQAIYLEERSNTSEQKLKQFKKMEHLRSVNFSNSYIKTDLVRFKGISEVNFVDRTQKQYLYSTSPLKKTSQSTININLSNLLSRSRRDQPDNNLNSSAFRPTESRKYRNPQDLQVFSQIDGKSVGLSSLRKYNL